MKKDINFDKKNARKIMVYVDIRERNYMHSIARMRGQTFQDIARDLTLRFISDYNKRPTELKIKKEISSRAIGVSKVLFLLEQSELDELNAIFDSMPKAKVRGHFLRHLFLKEFEKIEKNLLRNL